MKTIAIIPARGGSKRLPGKNIMQLGDLPLIAHSIRYAQAHRDLIDEVIVSTDDPAIRDVAIAFGATVIDRPAHLAGDHEPTVTALQHVLSVHPADRVVLLQPTNPLRPAALLREAMSAFESSGRSSLFTVSENRHKLGKIAEGKFIPFNYTPGQRSQDLEPLYFENGLLYICAASVVDRGLIITDDALPIMVSHPYAQADIDTAYDFKFAEWLLNTTHE